MKSTVCKFAAVGGLMLALSAQAIPLPPATSIPPVVEPDPIGGILIGSLFQPFSAPTFSGTLISKVWAGDLSNPFGGLTFTYELSNNLLSPDAIDRFTLSSYAGFQVDASINPGIAGIDAQNVLPPVSLPTSIVRNPAGNQISFNFTGPFSGTLLQGTSTPVMVLQTDSQGWQTSLAGVINSSTANVPTLAPLAVPEPTAAALLALGALGLGLRRKS